MGWGYFKNTAYLEYVLGCVICPTVFHVYVNDVLEMLNRFRQLLNRFRQCLTALCHTKNIFPNAFMISDDLLLALISLINMQ